MTATSSTTWPAGSSSSTAARASPTRATTPAGSSRSRPASRRRRRASRPAVARSRARWSGPACRRRPARPRARPACSATSRCCPRTPTRRSTASRSTSPRAAAWATSSSRPRASARASASKLLIEDLDFSLPPGGIVGVIGPNGAGKTTLFRMIAGQEQPDSGSLRLGDTRRARLRRPVARGARRREDRSGRRSPAASTACSVGKREVSSRAVRLELQLPRQRPAEAASSDLSGGERNRLHLAKLLRTRRQPAAARRAHERPRRRHAAGARGRARALRRLRGGHQP